MVLIYDITIVVMGSLLAIVLIVCVIAEIWENSVVVANNVSPYTPPDCTYLTIIPEE